MIAVRCSMSTPHRARAKWRSIWHEWPVDLMSFSAHKIYGPKGIGALYVGPRAQQRLQAQIHGGGHEGGLRSGTLATHQIAAMGAAFALAAAVVR